VGCHIILTEVWALAHDQAVKPKETEEPTASVPAEPSRSGNGVVTAADPERNPRQRARGRAIATLLIVDWLAFGASLAICKLWLVAPLTGSADLFTWAPWYDMVAVGIQDRLKGMGTLVPMAIYVSLLVVGLGRFGLYDHAVVSSRGQQAARIVGAHHWAAFWLFLLASWWATIWIDPIPLLAIATVAWVLNLLGRWIVQSFGMRAVFTERALVLGGSDEDGRIRQMEETFVDIDRVEFAGRVTPEELQAHGDTEATAKALLALARSLEVDAIVVAGGQGVDDRIYVALSLCTEEGVRVVRMPEYIEEWAMMVPVEYVNDAWRVYGFNHEVDPYYTVVHRLMDIVCATLGLLLFIVLFVPIALLIKLTSKGPIIYTSSDPDMMRVGLGGRKFRIFKFRTMTLEASKAVSRQKEDEDPRVTPVGRFLRKTKLDELPQMWNVLRGQMSIVGPRPICASEDEEMLERIPLYHLRRLVRPGLTGLGQVSFGTAKLAKEHLERLQYDLYYIKHRCFALDMAILARTTLVCLGLRSR
jgi:exopolysaccharide biosynthesis polyprenyl glycosylphosphotransferase